MPRKALATARAALRFANRRPMNAGAVDITAEAEIGTREETCYSRVSPTCRPGCCRIGIH
jgi:hypothetical protein